MKNGKSKKQVTKKAVKKRQAKRSNSDTSKKFRDQKSGTSNKKTNDLLATGKSTTSNTKATDKKTTGTNKLGAKLRKKRPSKSKQTLNDTSKGSVTGKRIKPNANDRTVRNTGKNIKQQDSQVKGAKQPDKIRASGKGKSKEVVAIKRTDGINNKNETSHTEKRITKKQKETIKKLRGQRSYINKKLNPLKEYVASLNLVKDKKKKVDYNGVKKTVSYIIKDKIKEIVALNKDLQNKGSEVEKLGGRIKWKKIFRDVKNEPQKRGVIRLAICMHFQMSKVFDYLNQDHIYNGFEHRFNTFITPEGNEYDIKKDSDKIIQWFLAAESEMESKNVFYLVFDLENNSCQGYIDKEPDKKKEDTELFDKSYSPKKKEVKLKEPQPRKIKPREI